jgi:transposase-like protein
MDSRAHRKAELSRKHWNAALAREVLADFAASGMSLTSFARSMGVNLQRLSWWRKRLESTAAVPKIAFVPATITRQPSCLLVRLPGGVEIEAMDPAAVPPQWVAELARSLTGRP